MAELRPLSVACALMALSWLGRAHAQKSPDKAPTSTTAPGPPAAPLPPSPPLVRRAAATPRGTVVAPSGPGQSNVAGEGIPGAPRQDPTAEPKDTTELSVSAGALLTGGNSRIGTLTGALKLLVRRGSDQFGAGAAANYARAATEANQPVDTTVENYQIGVRYDRFLSRPVSTFLSVVGRRDRFQGLAFRLSIDPGVALYMVREEQLRLWSEVGYDLQNDVRTNQAIADAAANGIALPPTELTHNGRLFFGYEQRIEETLRFDAGIEYIRNVLRAESWRLNYSTSLTTKVIQSLSIGVVSAALYDNNPLTAVEKLDVWTTLNLVYTLY